MPTRLGQLDANPALELPTVIAEAHAVRVTLGVERATRGRNIRGGLRRWLGSGATKNEESDHE
jgi:hypothetical protein